MDYLDPRKRRAHNIRLVVGYFLVAIVIGLATYIIRAAAEGYGINVKTGQVIQNALLFVDSKPGGAQIYLNGQNRNANTSARLILPAGNYTLGLKKDGYRDWSRPFVLSEGSVGRYVYPFLFPVKPVQTNLKTYTSQPGLVLESPDRHWLLVENNDASAQAPAFDEYDTSSLDQASPNVQPVSLPQGLLTNYSGSSKLTEVEWSTDNNNVLLEDTYDGGSEFIIFNRAHPDQSFNVDRTFGFHPDLVDLFNKKTAQLYLYRQTQQTLQLGDTSAKKLGPVLLKHVLAFKPYASTLITYVTDSGEPADTVAARIWSSGQSYLLNEFPAGKTYLIDAAQFQGNFYYAAGSDGSDRVNIYKNPIDEIKNPSYGKALPVLALRISGGQKIGFSDNARFVGIENGQRFAVYDFETESSFQYPISEAIAQNLSWMDGHRYIGNTGGKVLVMDYDGANKQLLTPSADPAGALFSRDYNHMLVITASSDGSSFVLQDVDMRAGQDLPASKQPAS
jgi:hypothetical protein